MLSGMQDVLYEKDMQDRMTREKDAYLGNIFRERWFKLLKIKVKPYLFHLYPTFFHSRA